MSTELAEASFRVQAGLAARDRDPLSWWRFAVPRLREAFGLFAGEQPIRELHARGPNKGTKTESSAAFVVACLQKRKTLDGIALPQWRGKVEAVQLVLDYQQQHLSVQAAYERVIGKWPVHPHKIGDTLMSLQVMPIGGDPTDRRDWSVVYFLTQKNEDTGTGVRADIVAFDEPPKMKVLRELRKAPHSQRPGIRIIAETPTKRSQWEPLKEDYGESPRRSIRRLHAGRAEVRWSLDEVEDWVLSPAMKAEMWDDYKGDPLFGEDGAARWHGDYTSVEGSSPWGENATRALLEMLSQTREPEMVDVRIPTEKIDGVPTTIARVKVQVYERPQPGAHYYAVVDPASGIDDGKHNPLCLHIAKIGTGATVLRWNGYMAPFSVGVLAAIEARQYNNAVIDIEMKDHWGVNVYRGASSEVAGSYGNLAFEQRMLTPGKFSPEVGFDMGEEAKKAVIGAVQEWLEAHAAGAKYGYEPSREVLNCLLDCELDEKDKIVASSSGPDHGEDLICKGRTLLRAVRRSGRETPELHQPPRTEMGALAALIRGGREDDDDDERLPTLRARERPRI